MKKPKVVFIASDPPMPPTGGGNRTFHFARTVAEVSFCHLFILFPIGVEKLPNVITGKCANVVASTKSFTSSAKGKLSILFYYLRLLILPWTFSKKQLILTAHYYISSSIGNRGRIQAILFQILRRTLTEYALLLYRFGYEYPVKTLERYDQIQDLKLSISRELNNADVLWLDFSSLFPYFIKIIREKPAIKVICNAHNIEYKYQERLEITAEKQLEKRWYKQQALIMKRVELEGFELCDLVITCSETDRSEIHMSLPDVQIEVIPNGVDLDYFKPKPNLTPNPSLLFTGTMGYKANNDAVVYFINNIFPLILKSFPECIFRAAGAGASDALREFIGMPGVEIVSSPQDMRPLYNEAWVVVVPLRSGSGTRLKILEAFAMEKAVVSTVIGAEGLNVSNGKELFIIPDEASFAEYIILLIEDFQLRNSMAQAGKEKVIETYNWNSLLTSVVVETLK